MSHFVCLVITDQPGEEAVSQALAPYHEFECTGQDDQYVQTIDKTAEAREEFEAETSCRLRDLNGNLHSPYDDRFYRDPTPEEQKSIGPIAGTGGNGTMSWHWKDWKDGLGCRTKVKFIPDGWEEIEVPTWEVQSFAKWASGWYGGEIIGPEQEPDLAEKHKYGWIRVDGTGEVLEVIDRTNPDTHWDWWVIGGRWDGFFRVKSGAEANEARKSDIDFDAMRRDAAEKAEAEYIKAHATIAGRQIPNWQAMIGKEPTDEHLRMMRTEYGNHPVIQDLRRAGFYFEVERFSASIEEFKARAADGACCPFAIVKDRQWYERGKMGWWGVVCDEKDKDVWAEEVKKLLDDLPPEKWLTAVDCHI